MNPTFNKETVIDRQDNMVRYLVTCKLVVPEMRADDTDDTQHNPETVAVTDDPTDVRVEDSEAEVTGTQEEPSELESETGPIEDNQLEEEIAAEVDHENFPYLQEAVADNSGKKGRKPGWNGGHVPTPPTDRPLKDPQNQRTGKTVQIKGPDKA